MCDNTLGDRETEIDWRETERQTDGKKTKRVFKQYEIIHSLRIWDELELHHHKAEICDWTNTSMMIQPANRI